MDESDSRGEKRQHDRFRAAHRTRTPATTSRPGRDHGSHRRKQVGDHRQLRRPRRLSMLIGLVVHKRNYRLRQCRSKPPRAFQSGAALAALSRQYRRDSISPPHDRLTMQPLWKRRRRTDRAISRFLHPFIWQAGSADRPMRDPSMTDFRDRRSVGEKWHDAAPAAPVRDRRPAARSLMEKRYAPTAASTASISA